MIEIVSAAGEYSDDGIISKVASTSDLHTVENLLEQVKTGLEIGMTGLEHQIKDGNGIRRRELWIRPN